MFETWTYLEKGKPKKYRDTRKAAAESKMLLFQSEDPEMPFYGRDPKEIKRDKRYQQLSRHEKDLFSRLGDELWIQKGGLPNHIGFIASAIEADDDSEVQALIDKCLELGLLKKHASWIYMPELREQYVRAVHKSDSRNTAGHPIEDDS